MGEWTRVKWTEAGQVTKLLGWSNCPDKQMPPQQFLDKLKRTQRSHEAVQFLAQALPRFEAVCWAVRFVRDTEPLAPDESPEETALRAALLWIQDPTEERRRAAYTAARAADSASAEALVTLAVFYSGGSVAPPDCEPLPAPRSAAGQFAAGAILVAAARSPARKTILSTAIDAGEKYAIDAADPVAG